MPGRSPPSATPNSARTATKEPNPLTKPRHMVRVPQRAVRSGSQMRGDIFFKTKLLGSSLNTLSISVPMECSVALHTSQCKSHRKHRVRSHIRDQSYAYLPANPESSHSPHSSDR
jgi:hypothetical protein